MVNALGKNFLTCSCFAYKEDGAVLFGHFIGYVYCISKFFSVTDDIVKGVACKACVMRVLFIKTKGFFYFFYVF